MKNINFSLKRPSTYFVLVPGISLLIQKIQLANILPITNEEFCEAKNLKVKGHFVASIAQFALATLLGVIVSPYTLQ